MMKELAELTKGKPNSQALLFQNYLSLGFQVKEQVESLRVRAAANPSLKSKLEGLLASFDKCLQRIASGAGISQLKHLHCVAETYIGLAEGLRKGVKATEYYKRAAAAYERMSKHEDAGEIAIAVKIRLARAKRGMGAYRDAINLLIYVLRENDRVLEAQKQACLTFTEWARNVDSKYYRYAMFGYYDSPKRAYTVWGWGRLAKMLQPKIRINEEMRSASTRPDSTWPIAATNGP